MRTPILTRALVLGSIVLAAAALALPSNAGGEAIAEAREALDAAGRALDEGDIAVAQSWSERAAAILAAVGILAAPEAEAAPPRSYPLGNAGQLLAVLEVYTSVADGTDPELDAQAAWLIAELEVVRWLDSGPDKPHLLGDRWVDYSGLTNLVRRVGDVAIDRDPFTHQIRRVGDIAIDYDPLTLDPRWIGEIKVECDHFTGELRSVGGIWLAP